MPNNILRVAAKAVILNKQNQVLFVRESSEHKTNTQFGGYGIPGGKIEPGESFYEGLNREVFEEIGLKVKPIKPLDIGEWRPNVLGDQLQIIAIFMLCEAKSHSVKLSEEHDDFQWFGKYELESETIKCKEPDRTVALNYIKAEQH